MKTMDDEPDEMYFECLVMVILEPNHLLFTFFDVRCVGYFTDIIVLPGVLSDTNCDWVREESFFSKSNHFTARGWSCVLDLR